MNLTSNDYNALKGQALDLIADLRDCQGKLNRLHESAHKLGLDPARKEGESELDWLSRVAQTACEKEHELKLTEARNEVTNTAKGLIDRSGPRTMIGRALGKLASIAG